MSNEQMIPVLDGRASKRRGDRLLDGMAFFSMVASVLGLVASTYLVAISSAYTFLRDDAARERFLAIHEFSFPLLAIYMAVAVVVAIALWIAMLFDCARSLSAGKRGRYVIWMVILVLFHISAAWLYYLIERRPRHAVISNRTAP